MLSLNLYLYLSLSSAWDTLDPAFKKGLKKKNENKIVPINVQFNVKIKHIHEFRYRERFLSNHWKYF